MKTKFWRNLIIPPEIAAVIPTINLKNKLRKTLETLFNQDLKSSYQVIVIDSGSVDGSVEMVREEFPNALLIIDPSRPGLNQKMNLAIQITKKNDYVALLNNDIRLESNYLSELRNFMGNHPNAGVVGPLVRDNKGFYYNGGDFLLKIGSFGVRRYPSNTQVPYVAGAAFFFRRKALENVRFDERIHFTSDVAICFEIASHGWKSYVTDSTEVFHDSHSSITRSKMKNRYFHSVKDHMHVLRQYKPICIPVFVLFRI
ncbi:MAG: glycosyltransferase, partial [Candidatus Hodarchaeota archaeon]